MFAALVRILLVLSLVMWSPAWCCCTVRALAAGSGAETAVSCCSRSMPQRDADEQRACCAVANDAYEDGSCSDAPCRCSDRVIEQQRLDTSVKVTPAPVHVPVHAVQVDSHVEAIAQQRTYHREQPCGRPPPAQSLMALSCMLLL